MSHDDGGNRRELTLDLCRAVHMLSQTSAEILSLPAIQAATSSRIHDRLAWIQRTLDAVQTACLPPPRTLSGITLLVCGISQVQRENEVIAEARFFLGAQLFPLREDVSVVSGIASVTCDIYSTRYDTGTTSTVNFTLPSVVSVRKWLHSAGVPATTTSLQFTGSDPSADSNIRLYWYGSCCGLSSTYW
jgi:hypothetical protein